METGQSALDIILVTHNRLGVTIPCVEALYEHTHIPFRLVVIDDSTDLTPAYFRDLQKQYGNVKYVRPEEEIIHSNQMINIGIKNSESDPFIFMVNSVRVEPDWLIVAHEIMMNQADVGLIGFKLIYPTNTIEHAGIYWEPNMPHHLNIGIGEPSHRYTHIRELDIVGWALILMRRGAVPKDGLDEKTFHGFRGYDDIDNCLMIRKAGWKVVYCGLGCAYHLALATRHDASDKAQVEYEENRQRFLDKWGGTEQAKKSKPITKVPTTGGRK